jgi:hypothetical protein
VASVFWLSNRNLDCVTDLLQRHINRHESHRVLGILITSIGSRNANDIACVYVAFHGNMGKVRHERRVENNFYGL